MKLNYCTLFDSHYLTRGLIMYESLKRNHRDFHLYIFAFDSLSETIQKKCKIIMLSTSDSFKDLNRANKNRFVQKFLNKPLNEQVLGAINI